MSDYKTYEVKGYPDGSKIWFLNGVMHREDGPAVEYVDGTKEWCLNAKLHRKDGPAIEHADGHKEWWLNGELHREDGPAVEYPYGLKEWWLNGLKEWWLNDEQYTEKNFHAEIARRKGTTVSCEGKIVEIDGKKYKLAAV